MNLEVVGSPRTEHKQRGEKENYSFLIDGLRIFAALLVLAAHVDFGFPSAVQNAIASGIGSGVFLPLAGFVALSSRSFWRKTWAQYTTARLARLLPYNIIAFFLLVPRAMSGEKPLELSELLSTTVAWLSGMQAIFTPGDLFWKLNVPAWCVSSLVIAAILLPATKWVGVQEFSTGNLIKLLVFLVGIRIAIEVGLGLPTNHFDQWERHIWVVPRVISIIAGGITAVLVERIREARFAQTMSKDWFFLASSSIILIVSVVACYVWGNMGGFVTAHGPLLPVALLLIGSAYLNRGLLHKMCSHRYIRHGANLSIFIYFFHYPIAVWLGLGFQQITGIAGNEYSLAAKVGVSTAVLIVSLVSAHLFYNRMESIHRSVEVALLNLKIAVSTTIRRIVSEPVR